MNTRLSEGSHAATSLSGDFGFAVYDIIGDVTEGARMVVFRPLGLHRTRRRVAGGGRVMFLWDIVQTRRFA